MIVKRIDKAITKNQIAYYCQWHWRMRKWWLFATARKKHQFFTHLKFFISICDHGNKYLPTPKENAPHDRNIAPQKRFFSTKKKSRKINVRLVKLSKPEKWRSLGTGEGTMTKSDTEKQISSENVNIEGEHVKTIELGYLLCLYISYASYMLS